MSANYRRVVTADVMRCGVVEHRGHEGQLAAVALDTLAAVGSGGGQRLLAVGVARSVVQRPFDERAGP